MTGFSFDTVAPDVCQQLADELYQVQDDMRQLQSLEKSLKQQLAAHLHQLASKDEPLPKIVGSQGQVYKLSKSNPVHKFDLPKTEYERLCILELCTPEPKMTKGQMDTLLKEGVINHADITRWTAEGWYSKEEGGELSIQQVKTKE